MNELSNWGPVAVIVGGYVIGFYFQSRRIDDLRDTVNNRFDEVINNLSSVNKRIGDGSDRIDDHLSETNEGIDDRFSEINSELPVSLPKSDVTLCQPVMLFGHLFAAGS